ncbi:hypothetical protein EB796_017264 [Bugula neritina]|uniref:PKD/Chitinase domain-containing protein n=1 Tax=Bugula neritina TaxID=10212 RepID=A0A7J7JEG5_BUGNE|nr:hypothetical protein EB796_017264 [Bugula neritina]
MLLHCIIIIVGLVLGATEGDICKGTTTSALESHVSSNYPPKGGAEAGNFTQINGVENFSECVKACCDDPTCNAAFFSKNKCLNIECVTDDGCSPDHDKTLPKAILVNVRTVAETAALHTSHNVSTDEPTTAPPSVQHLKNVTCEFGLQECGENEECKMGEEENRRANGICVCQENYSRDSSGKCVQLDTVTLTSAEKKSSVVPIQLPAHTTTAKSPPTTPKPKIVPLTVSAGDSKILEYPEDSTKLSAYAIPEPQPGETYTYQWSLVQAPDGDEKGQTSGMDSPTLILTKLVPGVYVLTVDVKGDNKQGSATVNVTVMPEPKAHTPPVAVIKPSVLNIKEGTTGILDGADSTVDGETKSYLWEIVSAPINDDYKLVNSKASILRLTGLSHGTYSIRLTVTDAAGLKNSTMAAVNVEEEVDYPPTANAGDDIVVNLPVNYVTLYGNTSTDDKGIHSYEWKATDTDSTTDLEGVHEPFLRLKHLTEGVYTFELLVTDTKGQTSKDEVRVFVQTSLNKPPVAMVEHNFTTAKPQDVVLLDGSPSSDDQGIVQYRWTQLSGPNQAKMDNSDRVKASVENLIEGEYVFKLTVLDAETLHDSATVTVQVKSLSSEKPSGCSESTSDSSTSCRYSSS